VSDIFGPQIIPAVNQIIADIGSDPGAGNGSMADLEHALRYLYDAVGNTGQTQSAAGTVLQRLLNIITELGQMADASSSGGTALARLAYLINYLLALGATGDSANPTGSAMARLADVENKLGAINPASGGTDTLFHYLYSVAADLVDLQTNRVGATGDAASSGGSALARLAYLINQLAAGVTIGRTAYWGSFSTSAASLQNALSVSGKGTLEHLAFVVPASTASWELKIALDGGVLSDITLLPSLGVYYFPSGDFFDDSNFASAKGWANAGANSATVINLSADFQTSLLIQLKGDATRAPSVFWHYNK
jgi:hypothetical protein